MNFNDLQSCTREDLYDLSLQSARAKEKIIRILEIGSLDKVIGIKDAEICRAEFLKNRIQIKQLTNQKVLESFSSNDEFIDTFWQAHYIDPKKYTINIETLIFDDIVAYYTVTEPYRALIIRDQVIADTQKQTFDSLWLNSMAPNLSFPKNTAGLFFLPKQDTISGIQANIYMDAGAEAAYSREGYKELQDKIACLFKDEYYKDASRAIIIGWANGSTQMLDVWKFTENYVDGSSGDLADVKVYKGLDEVTDIGRASSNTLVILGFEEKAYRMRMERNLSDLPSGFIIDQSFFVR